MVIAIPLTFSAVAARTKFKKSIPVSIFDKKPYANISHEFLIEPQTQFRFECKFRACLPFFSFSKSVPKSCGGDDSLTQDIKLRGPVPECEFTVAVAICCKKQERTIVKYSEYKLN